MSHSFTSSSSLLFHSKYFLIFLVLVSLTHGLYRSIFFFIFKHEDFVVITQLLVQGCITLQSENICIFLFFEICLDLFYGPEFDQFYQMFSVHLKRKCIMHCCEQCSHCLGQRLIVSFKSSTSLMTFCFALNFFFYNIISSCHLPPLAQKSYTHFIYLLLLL